MLSKSIPKIVDVESIFAEKKSKFQHYENRYVRNTALRPKHFKTSFVYLIVLPQSVWPYAFRQPHSQQSAPINDI